MGALSFDGAAQPRLGAAEESARRPARPSSQETKPFAASPRRSPEAERCANFRRELRDARRAEREAATTTSSDQASLRRQRLEEARQKAGC